jgi:RNA polymerase sigma-70 factor (ECF subfamily)
LSTVFEQILTDHGAMLSRLASSYEANHHLHQELLQEINVAVWQALKGFRGDSSARTYILRVAHNKAVNHVAYHARQPRNESYCEISEPSANQDPSSESLIGQQQQVQKLLSEVRKLPVQTRQIVTMSMEGLSYQEIAEVCGLSTSNVGVILNRGKKSLLESMQDDG